MSCMPWRVFLFRSEKSEYLPRLLIRQPDEGALDPASPRALGIMIPGLARREGVRLAFDIPDLDAVSVRRHIPHDRRMNVPHHLPGHLQIYALGSRP